MQEPLHCVVLCALYVALLCVYSSYSSLSSLFIIVMCLCGMAAMSCSTWLECKHSETIQCMAVNVLNGIL